MRTASRVRFCQTLALCFEYGSSQSFFSLIGWFSRTVLCGGRPAESVHVEDALSNIVSHAILPPLVWCWSNLLLGSAFVL